MAASVDMAQLLDSLPPDSESRILCCYVNATSQIQVARVTNIPSWYFERVVFPGQRLVFEALLDAQLEIHTGMVASSILSDTIPCDRLCIDEPVNFQSHPRADQEIEALNEGNFISEPFAAALMSVD